MALRLSNQLIDRLAELGRFPADRTTRVIIDLQAGSLPVMYTAQLLEDEIAEDILQFGFGLPRTLPVEAWRPS